MDQWPKNMHAVRAKLLSDGTLHPTADAKDTELYATEDFCNVSAESILGRRPDGQTERFSAINTGVMLRANEGDENDLAKLS